MILIDNHNKDRTISIFGLKVKVDFSNVPPTLKTAIMNQRKFLEMVMSEPIQSDLIVIDYKNEDEDEDEGGIGNVKRKIKDLLIKAGTRDYVVISDLKDKDKILIMERKEAEKQGSFHCHHCGMEFSDEILVGVHQRLHLPF